MIINYAKNFIKEYDIKSIDTNSLKRVISKLGYDFIVYNPLFNYDDSIAAIIEAFNIDSELKNTCCFTCKSELTNCIFVLDGIKEKELIHLLLHEMCHIYMHHIDENAVANSAYYEYEANKFADDVKYYVNQNNTKNRLKRKALYAVPIFLLSTLIVTVVALNFKDNKSDVFYYQEPSVDITETATEPTTTEITTTEPTIKSIITEETTESVKENDNEKMYYVSKSGKKYHLEDCNYINADKCTKLTLDEVEKLGYEPCKVCKPDKRN